MTVPAQPTRVSCERPILGFTTGLCHYSRCLSPDNFSPMSRLLAIALAYALLNGCATQAPVEEVPEVPPAEPVVEAAEVPERRIPDDSLYPLLLAEFAMRRQAYDVALDNYMVQAPLLRDAGVSAHTTHLTQFMQREEEALESAQLWSELDPNNAEAHNTLALLLARRGRTVEALPHMAAVERLSGEGNFPILLNGFGGLSDTEQAELVSGVNALAVEFPGNTRVLMTQALIHTELKQYDAALDKLDQVFELEPQQAQAILLEARILADQGAKKPYARVEKILARNPDDTVLRMRYARLLTITDMAAARKQFEILSARSPGDADLLFSLALINREINDDLAAAAYLRQVIALGQRTDEARYYLGSIAEDKGETEEALARYMEVEDSREYLPANSRISHLLIETGQLQRSQDWFDQQRERYPERLEQLYGLEADILTQFGNSQAAIDVLSRALVDMPENHNLRYARAMIYEQGGDLAAMEQELRNILRQDPDNTTALNALGYTLANRTTRYDEALQLVSRALELQPNEPAILDSMGWVLFRTGRYDEALEYLTRAYANFPDPEVAAHLGEVLWVTGDTESALAVWRGAALRAPDHPILRDTLRRLGITDLNDIPATDAAAPARP